MIAYDPVLGSLNIKVGVVVGPVIIFDKRNGQ